jgi:hypothetical protein
MDRNQPPSFAGHLVSTLTGGALTMLISVGYRVGLFEVVAPGPATGTVLAARAGLRERYVEEWLGAMVTGGFFGYDRVTGQYYLPHYLPPGYARLLAGDGAANVAPVASMQRALGRGPARPGLCECGSHAHRWQAFNGVNVAAMLWGAGRIGLRDWAPG